MAHETAKTRTTRGSSSSKAGRLGQKIELVQHDDLRELGEPGAVRIELAVDDLELLRGISRSRVDDVDEHARALEVREELVAEPDAFAGALDQAGDVGDRQLAAVGRVDGSQDRLERGKGVLGDLGPGIGDAPQKRGLARVREPRQRCVRHQLEPELERPLVTRQPGLGKARRLPRRRREPLVPTSPRATLGDDGARPRPGQVRQDRPLLVEDLRADRDAQLDGLARGAALVRALPVLAAAGAVAPPALKRAQVAQIGIGDEDDVSTGAAVAAVRAALGHAVLAAERHAAVAAAPRRDEDSRPIVEHSGDRPERGVSRAEPGFARAQPTYPSDQRQA